MPNRSLSPALCSREDEPQELPALTWIRLSHFRSLCLMPGSAQLVQVLLREEQRQARRQMAAGSALAWFHQEKQRAGRSADKCS